jgi:opacity protein-like surface antigen
MQPLKRLLQTCLMLVLSFNAFAQPASKDWMLSVEGNYYKSKSSESNLDYQFKSNEKEWHFSFNAERFVTDRFSLGLGLARYHEKLEENTQQVVLEATGSGVHGTFTEAEGTVWLPRIFCKYYWPVIGRFYLVPRFSGSYGRAKANASVFSSSVYHAPTDHLSETDPGTLASRVEVDVKGNLLSMELAPELAYFFGERWGLSACLGGWRYDRFGGDLDVSDWTFSFKRQYWKLGVNFRF